MELRCPLCEKIVGRRIVADHIDFDGYNVAVYENKYDHRKVSKVLVNYCNKPGPFFKYHVGLLCKTCAREKFPEGRYWKITYYDGTEAHPLSGDYGDIYVTREKAEQDAETFNKRITWSRYTVTEYTI